MKSFLSNVAETIVGDRYHGPDSVIILPNRRAEIFLKQELKKINSENLWLPEFYPVDMFIQRLSGYYKSDNISLSLDLYKVYKKIEGDDSRDLEEFLTWASLILNDFNDIDNALANHNTIYRDLSAVKEIEHWDPSRNPLSDLQLGYLRFFKSMSGYYEGLQKIMHERKSGYHGFINRYLAANIGNVDIPWNRFLVVGVNAFTEAEIKIFEYLNANYNVQFLWDIDDYYFNETPGGVTNEAGQYIKYIIHRLKLQSPERKSNLLRQSSKNIQVLGVSKNIGQAKFIGQELLKNKHGKNTAIVLSDESLLIPLLNSLPKDSIKKYNITLGYPLVNSPADHFLNNCIEVTESLIKYNFKVESIVVIRLLSNPLTRIIVGGNVCSFVIKTLLNSGLHLIGNQELLEIVSARKNSNKLLLENLLVNTDEHITESFLNGLMDSLTESLALISKKNTLIREEIKSLIAISSKLISYQKESNNQLNINSLKKVSKQVMMHSTIDLVGEPLEGIQIMGMLETRTLDFDNIYILSANEGILPKTNTIESFIPFDIRRENKLPLPSFKTGIYAYHFFRLIQRCSNLTVLYGTESEKIGGGEKSRFILQMENELFPSNPDIIHSNKVLTTNPGAKSAGLSDERIIIKKDKLILEAIEKLGRTGYSASVLGGYITCPLKFYFQRILNLQIDNTLDQTIEANVFGTVVHAVLERIYKPFIGKVINPKAIQYTKQNINNLLKEEFVRVGKGAQLGSGKNLLLFEVAHSHINRFLSWDIKNLSKWPAILIGTENRYNTLIPGSGEIIIKGTIDRIDKIQSTGRIRIIDYKTGSVKPNNLRVKDFNKITTDPNFDKAFQVMFYTWLYSLTNQETDIQSGIISTRNISNGFMELKINGYESITGLTDHFGDDIRSIIQDIRNTDIDFTQTTDKDRCKYCDYKSICNR